MGFSRKGPIWSLDVAAGWLLLVALGAPLSHAVGQGGRHLLRGRVVDAVTGAPVARADVFVLGQRRPARTDASGQFRQGHLVAASYLLQVRKEGYVTMTWEVEAVLDTSVVRLFELRPLSVGNASGQASLSFIQGRIVDRDTEEPLQGAEVFVLGRPEPVISDSAGKFRHGALDPTQHVLHVRKIGYEPITVQLAAVQDSMIVYVVDVPRTNAVMLDSVLVLGLAEEPSYWHREFESRRREGRGQFVTRREIEQRRAASVGELLRPLNGLRMQCSRQGCEVRMSRTNCRPAYFADGYPVDATTVERMPVNDIFGVEVYDLFEVPVLLQRAELRCGVIAVWTRRGPPPR